MLAETPDHGNIKIITSTAFLWSSVALHTVCARYTISALTVYGFWFVFYVFFSVCGPLLFHLGKTRVRRPRSARHRRRVNTIKL